MQNDCDYCNNEEAILEEYEAGEGNIRSLKIVFIPELRHIRVRTETEDGCNFAFGIDERINYCPMCGNKLRIATNSEEVE